MAEEYSNQELTDMLLIYGEARKDQRQAAQLYAERYPNRRYPNHGFFHSLENRLVTYGALRGSRRRINPGHRAEAYVAAVRQAVEGNPHVSTRVIARDLKWNYTTVHRIIKKDLGMRPWKRHTSQQLHSGDPPRRMALCDWVADRVDLENVGEDSTMKSICVTDEATFQSSGSINRHNEYHYAVENPHCRKETNVQSRFSVNVWAGIVGDYVLGPHFIEGNVNAESYAHFLDNELDLLMENVPLALRQTIIFQQDGHPAHSSRRAREVLDRKFPGRWIGLRGPIQWPPRSPDLTAMDFFLWGFIKDRVYQDLPQDRENLCNRIRTAFALVTPEILRKVRENFVKRVALCAEREGGFFENFL